MRKIVTATIIVAILAGIQLITYYTIARDQLAEKAIKNIEINSRLLSDTIIFSTEIAVHGNQKETIRPYNLNLLNKENFRAVKNKLSPSVVLQEADYAKYCEQVSTEAAGQLDSLQFVLFTDNLQKNKSRIYITALEEQKFFVTVNYNWSANKEFFYEEGQYVWLFFSWLNI